MNPVILIVLDGWGYREEVLHNAVAAAHTPNFDRIWNNCPHTLLEASGLHVGLPEGQMGNSEVGHTTIGAGAIMDTDLVRIGKAAQSGEFATNPVFRDLFSHVQTHGSTLHILGLLSQGGVHSHQDHLIAFLKAAKETGISKIAIHAFTDGRDVAPRSGADSLEVLEKHIEELGIGHIASVSGRYYAMDRDSNFHRLAKTEEALFASGAPIHATRPSEALRGLYKEGSLDEHLLPMVFVDQQGDSYPIKENDAVFIFNFRSDRVRMLTSSLLERKQKLNLHIATMTQYDPAFEVAVAFPVKTIETTLGAEVSKAGLTQVHIAETEKFPHATYFLNGGRKDPHEGEEHVMLESRKDVMTHDQAPEMRAEGIADAAIERLQNGVDFMFINFANPDMVGHTANKEAIITALETVDTQLQRVLNAIEEQNGVALVTADHGNAEVNVDVTTGENHTSHTTNPVPFIVVGADVSLHEGGLADIAPTVLELLDVPKPVAMTGASLLN